MRGGSCFLAVLVKFLDRSVRAAGLTKAPMSGRRRAGRSSDVCMLMGINDLVGVFELERRRGEWRVIMRGEGGTAMASLKWGLVMTLGMIQHRREEPSRIDTSRGMFTSAASA